ncbi:peptidase M13 [Canibacter sp. lx-72]|uniref:M13 family metallopeptidase n=1 Tax=Canibacter zhuwentaonis TaxID=2837491 RepID=UPI001BDCA5C9|nr:M13-type metalloendopeptidase [Canibacter zhuwentaonis]MBT1018075.1 peptidase M13 [Canibacter zhuwentaonis]
MATSGINKAELDSAVRPQDDLYRHVNGKWLARTEIPADKARYGAFSILAENAEDAVRDIIIGKVAGFEDPADKADLTKINTLFNSFMDEAKLRELGAQPLQPDIRKILGINKISEFVRLTAQFDKAGVAGLVSMFINNDPGDPRRYVLFIAQGGLGLPDESYYREAAYAQLRDQYVAHIQKMFELVSIDDAAQRAHSVMRLESDIAKHHWDRVASRDIQKVYNLISLAQLQETVPGINWQLYFDELGQTLPAEVVLCQPSAVAEFARLLTAERLTDWRNWLLWHLVAGSSEFLSPEISAANFEFYGTALTGATQQRERWRRGVGFAEGAMGEALGRLYVSKHFDETAKERMHELVAYLIDAYRDSINSLEWMSPATRARALEKLEKFVPKIGYPVKWRDYSALEVSDSLLENARAVARFETAREFAKLGKPVDRDEWFMTPQTVNAYYNPTLNEIVFPAAVLQPPFFDKNADMAANFGAIGAVIGHEIGHGFDDQGSRYDGDGKLTNWWTQADRTAFEQRTGSLIAQYNQLSPEGADGKTVNGEFTIGENIGDLGGLSIAWLAYNRFLNGADAPVIDGMSAAERFFYAWAAAWQQAVRPAEVQRLLTIDPHSPNEFRCNQIVRNIDVFHKTFNTKPGDKLWLDPAERVTIW